jgi:uroporphyrinogen-III decarboxylase
MTLLNGTPAQITAEAQACIEQNGSTSGFILGSGCVVPPAAAAENLLALAHAAAGAVAPGVA